MPGTEQVKLRLVNSEGKPDDFLAHWLLPKSASLDTQWLEFNNPTKVAVTVLNVNISLRGEHMSYQLTEAELQLPHGQQTLPPREISALTLTLNRSSIPADHYTGAVYLTLDGREEMLIIPVDLSVRDGPGLPLIALLMGIIVGQLVKYMQERGFHQSESLDAVNNLKYRINQEEKEDDKKVMLKWIKDAEQLVYRGKLETVPSMLEAIEQRLNWLKQLRDEEAVVLELMKNDPKFEKVLENIREARMHVYLQQDDAYKKAHMKVLEALMNIKTKSVEKLMGEAVEEEGEIDEALRTLIDQATKLVMAAKSSVYPITLISSKKPLWQRLWERRVSLSGVFNELRAYATLWLGRPLMYIALILGLVAVGMGSLYVENGVTFGVNRFSDYLGLILWGLSSDIASRTISTLQVGSKT